MSEPPPYTQHYFLILWSSPHLTSARAMHGRGFLVVDKALRQNLICGQCSMWIYILKKNSHFLCASVYVCIYILGHDINIFMPLGYDEKFESHYCMANMSLGRNYLWRNLPRTPEAENFVEIIFTLTSTAIGKWYWLSTYHHGDINFLS